jgi:predicted phage-related endonuclease
MLEVINCEQNTPEWHQARTGIITASSFRLVLAKGDGKTRATYMRKLAAERIRGVADDNFTSNFTERGHEFEDVAVDLYKEHRGLEIEKCGFLKRGNIGYSPDGLIGVDGAVEIKTRNGDLQIALLLSDKIPSEHIAQIQGGLLVSGRKWVDFVSYCPGLPMFIKRAERDENYILNLQIELALFEKELKELTNNILTKF